MGYIVGVVRVNDIHGGDNDSQQLFMHVCEWGVEGRDRLRSDLL